MHLITRSELAGRSLAELCGLLRQCFNALAMSAPDSAAHRNALASIENIQAELAVRSDGP